VKLNFDLSGFKVVAIDMDSRRAMEPDAQPGNPARIIMHRFNADVLLVATR
jgi:hypothetical protein